MLKILYPILAFSLIACNQSTSPEVISSTETSSEENSSNELSSSELSSNELSSEATSSATSSTLSSSSSSENTFEQVNFIPMQGTGNYSVQGDAQIIKDPSSGNFVLQLADNFSTSSGPDLYVFLTSDLYETGNGTPDNLVWQSNSQVGSTESNSSGAQTFDLSELTQAQVESIKSIRIYCQRFGYILWGGSSVQ